VSLDFGRCGLKFPFQGQPFSPVRIEAGPRSRPHASTWTAAPRQFLAFSISKGLAVADILRLYVPLRHPSALCLRVSPRSAPPPPPLDRFSRIFRRCSRGTMVRDTPLFTRDAVQPRHSSFQRHLHAWLPETASPNVFSLIKVTVSDERFLLLVQCAERPRTSEFRAGSSVAPFEPTLHKEPPRIRVPIPPNRAGFPFSPFRLLQIGEWKWGSRLPGNQRTSPPFLSAVILF